MAFYRPSPSQRRKARDITTKRAQAGLGDLVMKQETPTETQTTRYTQPAYGPPRKYVSKKKKPKKEE